MFYFNTEYKLHENIDVNVGYVISTFIYLIILEINKFYGIMKLFSNENQLRKTS